MTSFTDRARAEINAGPGWYEVINPRDATTCIALVYSDGSLYFPEGEQILGLHEFWFAAARGQAHRLVRADEAEQDPTEEELSHTHREVAESMTKMWQSERERADRLAEKLTDDPTEDEIEAAAMAIFAEHEPAYFHQKVHTKAWNVLMDQFRDAARAALLAAWDVRKEQGR